jgi:hypothetical protein
VVGNAGVRVADRRRGTAVLPMALSAEAERYRSELERLRREHLQILKAAVAPDLERIGRALPARNGAPVTGRFNLPTEGTLASEGAWKRQLEALDRDNRALIAGIKIAAKGDGLIAESAKRFLERYPEGPSPSTSGVPQACRFCGQPEVWGHTCPEIHLNPPVHVHPLDYDATSRGRMGWCRTCVKYVRIRS